MLGLHLSYLDNILSKHTVGDEEIPCEHQYLLVPGVQGSAAGQVFVTGARRTSHKQVSTIPPDICMTKLSCLLALPLLNDSELYGRPTSELQKHALQQIHAAMIISDMGLTQDRSSSHGVSEQNLIKI